MTEKKRKTKEAGIKMRFAGYPAAQAYENSDGKKKVRQRGQLPWGFIVYDTGKRAGRYQAKDIHGALQKGKYAACHRRNKSGGIEKGTTVWIREHELQDERCLEVVFVDIGQGDGCYLVAPSRQVDEPWRMVIDAGEASNMRHYLNWRHGSSKKTTFDATIISHPDSDHYKGFEALFERDNFYFETIYTNGLMERIIDAEEKDKFRAAKKAKKNPLPPEPTALGPVQKHDGTPYVTELVRSLPELKAFLKKEKHWVKKSIARTGTTTKKKDGKQFPTMLNEALEGWKRLSEGQPNESEERRKTMGDFRMLSVEDEWLPGFKPSDQAGGGKDLTIQVLGPVTETLSGVNKGKPMLRRLKSNDGKTKNGHSVVLRLDYGKVSMMLGGDLNIPSEHLLMSHHTGMDSPPKREHEAAFLQAVRKVFQVDIAKSCHHGSSDFTHWFLQALNPIATVISSGDNEPHSHPRSDTLGAIGFYSRSQPRPLIFSTELARSAKDSNQKPWELRSEIMQEVEKILKAKPEKQEAQKEKLKAKLVKDIPRSVAVYGAITVVTDGEKVIIYQKLERRGSHGAYDIYRLEPSGKDGKGPLIYQSKH